nr:uncharacterized protein LOC111413657 [Onthophagus taurus]
MVWTSIQVAICMTAQTILPEQIFTEGLNWGISYELPNDTSSIKQFFKPKPVLQRRHRRDLYQKMEVIMNSMGFDGRSCILKALCETTRKLMPRGNTIVEELLRIVFRFPQQHLLNSEPEDHRIYHWASRMGKDSAKECTDMFPGCTFSLIDMALGEYSSYF